MPKGIQTRCRDSDMDDKKEAHKVGMMAYTMLVTHSLCIPTSFSHIMHGNCITSLIKWGLDTFIMNPRNPQRPDSNGNESYGIPSISIS